METQCYPLGQSRGTHTRGCVYSSGGQIGSNTAPDPHTGRADTEQHVLIKTI